MPANMPEAEPLLTPQEVATMFRVDPKTVTRWAKAGKLTSVRTLGGHRRYRENEVRALLADIPQQRAEKPADPMRAPVHTLWPAGQMPAKIASLLKAGSVLTVGDLTGLSKDDLKHLGLRPPQIDEVRLVLHGKGLALHGEIASNAA